MQYSYDSTGQLFAYFLVTAWLVFLVPQTAAYARRVFGRSSASSASSGESDDARVWSRQQLAKCEKQRAQLKRTWRNPRVSWRLVLWLVGWTTVAWLVVFVVIPGAQQSADGKDQVAVFDPYAILELDSGAEVDEIKRRYKRMSLKW